MLSSFWALHFKWDVGKQNQPKLSKALEGRLKKLIFCDEKAKKGLIFKYLKH